MKNHLPDFKAELARNVATPNHAFFWSPWENMGGGVILWGKIIVDKCFWNSQSFTETISILPSPPV